MRTAFVVALLYVSFPAIASAQHADADDTATDSPAASAPDPFESDADEEGDTERIDELFDSKVLFSGSPEYGIYLTPTAQVSNLQGTSRAFLGGRGGLVVSDTLRIGAGANWLIGGPRIDVEGRPKLRMRYGGGLVGINVGADAVVHPSFDVLIGGGRARYLAAGLEHTGRTSSFFVVDAATGLDINLTYGVRLHVGGGYRYISSFEMPGLTARQIGGPFGMAQLKFGAF